MTFVDLESENSPSDSVGKERKTESKKTNKESGNEWGYDLYPERRHKTRPEGLTGLFSSKGKNEISKIKCERSVYRCIKESPLVKLMVGALKFSGCPIDIRRHISCEECAPNVSGGYDPILNQVVICHNTVKKDGMVQGVLTHEFIHMLDFCQNQLDFKNIDHLACTEIRAANLAHCSFISSWINGDSSPFRIARSHADCVKSKALSSMLAVRNITKIEAVESIERVFDKCYNDLEPIGRRLRRNSADMYKAYEEGFYYGYAD